MTFIRILMWSAVAATGAAGLTVIATVRGEEAPSVLWFIVAAVCVYAVAYRFYSRFIADKILELDDSRATPAVRLDNGRDCA